MISVALCTYNGERYIRQQMDSILHQDETPDEIVICDDGSTDHTDEIVAEIVSQSMVPCYFYKNEKNLGYIHNFEKAISLCKGDIVFLSDQDNEDLIKNNLKDLVRDSVEETLNALLDHEADELVRAGKYERTGDRKGYRFGHYKRNFGTTFGEVKLRVPKLKGIQFETAIIERYKRRECSVGEALIEMYLAGVSVRRVEDITETLWGTKVSSGTISNLNQKAYKHIEEWRQRPLTGEKRLRKRRRPLQPSSAK